MHGEISQSGDTKHVTLHLKQRRPDGSFAPVRLTFDSRTGEILAYVAEPTVTIVSAAPQAPPTDYDQDVLRFFSDIAPCFFDGCDALRAQWRSIKADLKARDCAPCEEGDAMRTFRRTHLDNHPHFVRLRHVAPPAHTFA